MTAGTWRVLAAITAGILLFAACSSTPPTSTASATIAVKAGVNDPKDRNIAVLAFLPAVVTVKVGQTVQWTASGPEPHTISFAGTGKKIPAVGSPEALAFETPKTPGGPYDGTSAVTSGLGPKGSQPMVFSLSFSRAGTYTYFCAIHAQMKGTVSATDDASKAESQTAVTVRGNRELAPYLAEGEAAKRKLQSKQIRKTKNSNGTTTFTILMGTSTAHTAVLAFQPPSLSIKTADRLLFVNDSAQPHTATFALHEPPPRDPQSEKVLNASGPSPLAVDERGYFNSGWLPANAPPGSAPSEASRSFTFIIPFAGSYTFVCVLHIASGMGGSIKVS